MFNLNDCNIRGKFIRKERIKRNIFRLMIGWIYFSGVLIRFFSHSQYRTHIFGKHYQKTMMLIAPSVLLLFTFICLLYKLFKYHRFQFTQIFKGIFLFSIFEIGISIFVLYKILFDIEKLEGMHIFLFQGYYLIFQTLGLIFLKKSNDPFQAISVLDCYQLVSSN